MQTESNDSKKPRPRKAKNAVDKHAWLEAARAILVSSGIDNVKVEPLAAQLQIARSSFYWHFENRQALLDALLDYWVEVNNRALRELTSQAAKMTEKRAANTRGVDTRTMMRGMIELFVDETKFSPKFDLAIREWARKDTMVARAVRDIDQERIKLLTRVFVSLGHAKGDSLIRAKILYFHQLGYYMTGIEESTAVRMRAAPRYLEILSGVKISE